MNSLDILNDILQDIAGVLTEVQKQNLIALATERVLVDYPLFKIEQLTYVPSVLAFSLPSGWVDGVSFIESIWDSYGRKYSWNIVIMGGTRYIRAYLPLYGYQIAPDATVNLWGRYSTTPSDTFPLTERHNYLIGIYAAYLGLEEIATYYAQSSDPTMTVDVVNYRDKSRIYSERADKILALYYKTLGEWRYGI